MKIDSAWWTAVATVFLTLIGFVQLAAIRAQHRREQMAAADQFRRRWQAAREAWAQVVFVGRSPGEYYQAASASDVAELTQRMGEVRADQPTIWALNSIREVAGLLSDVCVAVLEGRLSTGDAYSVFGTTMLRQGRPLRSLLEPGYGYPARGAEHGFVQTEVQDWLLYHDGLRRRCLILIDLMWAEGVRRLDLPPADMLAAAEAKRTSGQVSRERMAAELGRLGGQGRRLRSFRLTRLLQASEFRRGCCSPGLDEQKVHQLDERWTERLLAPRNEGTDPYAPLGPLGLYEMFGSADSTPWTGPYLGLIAQMEQGALGDGPRAWDPIDFTWIPERMSASITAVMMMLASEWPGASAEPLTLIGGDSEGGLVAALTNDPDAEWENSPIAHLGPNGEAAVIAADLEDFTVLLARGFSPAEMAETTDVPPEPSPILEEFARQSHPDIADQPTAELMKRARSARPDFPATAAAWHHTSPTSGDGPGALH